MIGWRLTLTEGQREAIRRKALDAGLSMIQGARAIADHLGGDMRKAFDGRLRAMEQAAWDHLAKLEKDWEAEHFNPETDLGRQFEVAREYFWEHAADLPEVFTLGNEHLIGTVARMIYMANTDPAFEGLFYPMALEAMAQGWPLGERFRSEGWITEEASGPSGAPRWKLGRVLLLGAAAGGRAHES